MKEIAFKFKTNPVSRWSGRAWPWPRVTMRLCRASGGRPGRGSGRPGWTKVTFTDFTWPTKKRLKNAKLIQGELETLVE